jgi:ketosteroid isomerase-like protein
MATAQQNEAQAREAYAAFAAGDLDKVKTVFHPDIVWHVAGSSPVARDYTGIDDVLGFFGAIFTETAGTFTNTLKDIIADDTTVVAIGRVRAERRGKVIDAEQVAVYRHDAEGKVIEASFYSDDTTRFDAFFS